MEIPEEYIRQSLKNKNAVIVVEDGTVYTMGDFAQVLLDTQDDLKYLQKQVQWHDFPTKLPQNRQTVEVEMVFESGKHAITVAEYIAPKSVLEENYMDADEDPEPNFCLYDEEKDCYWVPTGFFENQHSSEKNYFITDLVIRWRALPLPVALESTLETGIKE